LQLGHLLRLILAVGTAACGASGTSAPAVHDAGAPDSELAPHDGASDTTAHGHRDASTVDAGAAKHDAHDGGAAAADGTASDAGGVVVPPLPALPAGAGSGTTYYVSPSGDDTSAGTSQSTPWKSLTKVTSFAFGAGDTVLFEGGALFSGCPVFNGARIKSTASAPLTVGAYGTGPFTLQASCGGGDAGAHMAALSVDGMNGFYLHDCKITGNGGGAEYGIFLYNDTATTTDYVRVEACDISGFYTPDVKDYGGEIFIAGEPGPMNDIELLNNTLHGANGASSPDDNGITGYGGKPITNVLYQGNLVYDIGGKADGLPGSIANGILAIGIDGGVVQYNVAHSGGGNTTTCGGPAGIWTYSSNNVVIQYNEVYGMGPVGAPAAGACDWDGYDLDGFVTNSTLQYNWSHDNYGGGFLAFIAGTWGGNTTRYNISQNDGQGLLMGGASPSATDVAIYANTLYSAHDTSSLFELGSGSAGSIAGHVFDNVFFMAGKGQLLDVPSWNKATDDGLLFLGNDYYSPAGFALTWNGTAYTTLAAWVAATGEETLAGKPVALAVDPQMAAPGTAGTVGGYEPSKLDGYLLVSGSPLLGTGLDPKAAFGIDAGAQDYFGHAIPGSTGSGYNVGADGAE